MSRVYLDRAEDRIDAGGSHSRRGPGGERIYHAGRIATIYPIQRLVVIAGKVKHVLHEVIVGRAGLEVPQEARRAFLVDPYATQLLDHVFCARARSRWIE